MNFSRTLLVILLVLGLAPPLCSAETLVKPETATPIEICPSCKEVHVLLVPDCKSKINLNEGPRVEAAYFNGAAPRDATRFSAQWIGGKIPREINIVLDPSETKQAGTYDLYLNLQPDSHPGAGRLKIQLTRPAASLEAIPKLIINRTYWFIALSSDSYPDLRVTETSKKSGITISGVRPVSNSVIGTSPIGGTLKFADPPKIEPGNQAILPYTLDGGFGLGTATGTMKIDAPQLASPASFDFEVRSRAHWIWIGITIIAALYTSYLVKVKLQQKIELDQATLDAQKLVERIEREAQRHADQAFTGTYRSALNDLTTAMGNRIATDINKYKLELDSKWQTALKEHEKKHQDEEQALNKLRDQITEPRWLVPPDIVKAIEDARRVVADVEPLIIGCSLADASKKREEIITGLQKGILTGAIHWQNCEQEIIKAIQKEPIGIPKAISAELAKATTDILASLHKIDENTKLDMPEQINLVLREIEVERTGVYKFLDWLSITVQNECDIANEQIPKPPPATWDKETFDKAATGTKGFREFLKTLVDVPDTSKLHKNLGSVHKAWSDALQEQFTTHNVPVPLSVTAQLAAREYAQATKAAVQEKLQRAGIAAVAPAGVPFTVPPFYRDTAGAGALVYANYTRYQTVTTPAPAVPTSVTAEDRLRKDKRFQSLMIGLVLVVAGYGLQLNTFVGTFTEFSTLFFWAFALDLTVEQVGKIIKKP